MKNKKPKIFNINQSKDFQAGSSLTDMLDEVNGLLMAEKYEEALDKAKIAKHSYPNNPFCHISEALSYSMLDKKQEAAEILENAAEKFPGNFEILYQLGGIYNNLGEYESALYAVEESLELTPEYNNRARSECYNELGVIYWNMNLKDEAIKQWKLAINEDAGNIQAEMNLRDFTNDFGEPASISQEMDDIFHFQKVQIEKYLKSKKRKEFKDEEEVEKVVNHILSKWNEELAPQRDKLDNSNSKQKSKWFRSIKIDFTKKIKKEENKKLTVNNIPATINEMPEWEQKIMPFTLLLLGAAGISTSRIRELYLENKKITESELGLIEWALDIVDNIIYAQLKEKNKTEREKLMDAALRIAEEELEPQIAEKVITFTVEEIKEVLNKKQKKKGKRKK